ncbi:MAG: LysM peptidoglycan-binding domain-containing protein [Elusimicrobiota bacterium]
MRIRILIFICLFFLSGIVIDPLHSKIIDVEVRKGDTLHGFAEKYLKDPSKWPEIYRLNKESIDNPDKIYPGQIIKIPQEMLKDKVGDLTKIDNNVKVKKREKTNWRKGISGERLFPEDGIMTGRNSFARVDFLIGSNLKVYENSLIYLRPTIKKTAVASLLEGGLNVKRTKILTPSAEVIPRGSSEFEVDVDKQKTTKVSVRQGAVDVKGQKEKVKVMEGFRTIVEYKKEPEAPVVLPIDGNKALEMEENFFGDKELVYLVQVSSTESFNNVINESKSEIIDLKKIKRDLNPGKYFWRACVLDKQGFRGEYSEPRVFYIRKKANTFVELTGFELINKKERIMRIKGEALNAESVVINGFPAKIKNDGEFSTTIVLSPGQKTITATAIGSAGIVIRKYHRTDEGMWLPVK